MAFPPLSVSVSGLPRAEGAAWAGSPRRALAWVAGLGARAVQLDGAAVGSRARELDRSARRDLAAAIRRAGLVFSGIDLWIPPEHFADAAHQDRALAALAGALELSLEIAGLVGGAGDGAVVSGWLPEVCPAGVVTAVAEAADAAGAVFADHGPGFAAADRPGSVGAGVDPASSIMAERDPTADIAACGDRLRALRVSDASVAGRRPVGRGRLDLLGYAAASSVSGFAGWAVVDLRGLEDPDGGARAALAAWERAGTPFG